MVHQKFISCNSCSKEYVFCWVAERRVLVVEFVGNTKYKMSQWYNKAGVAKPWLSSRM